MFYLFLTDNAEFLNRAGRSHSLLGGSEIAHGALHVSFDVAGGIAVGLEVYYVLEDGYFSAAVVHLAMFTS